MKETKVARSTIGRLPAYLRYLRMREASTPTISATIIAKELGLGEVQVRKDLSAVCGVGRPKIGYETRILITSLEAALGHHEKTKVILVGAGKLGKALLDYAGFQEYGLEIAAAFDAAVEETITSPMGKSIYPVRLLPDYIHQHGIRLAIIAVPAQQAQTVCDLLVENHIRGILSFAPCGLNVPENVCLQQENMALSLAYLNNCVAE